MLAHLRMVLQGDELTYRKASSLQGVLMERLDTDYAEKLHSQQMRPYSQYLSIEDGKPVWHVSTLDYTSYEKIICRLMDGWDEFQLHSSCETAGKHVRIMEKKLETLKKTALLQDFYSVAAKRRIRVEFLVPTAFRQSHRYVILPDIRLLCQSLMVKYSSLSSQVDLVDEDTLEQIVDNSILAKHRIRSLPFPLEGTVIPGFVGNIEIHCKGTETMARYLRLLLRFGEYSGVGVRTAMGMGAIHIRRYDE